MNGKSAEWLRFIATAIVSALIAYFTAQISTENRLTTLETKQTLQYEEVQRALVRIEMDLRDVKRSVVP